MTSPNGKATRRVTPGAVAAAALTDTTLILVFAAVWRDAHQRGDALAGVFLTAWPFLAGAALGWLVAKAWRQPFSVRKAGIPVWLGSLTAGMLLRALTGQAAVLPFIIVALLSLGLLLLGYRLLVAGARRLRKA